MRYFYAMMVWFSEFELAVAYSTGRRQSDIDQLRRDLSYWEAERDRYEVRHACR